MLLQSDGFIKSLFEDCIFSQIRETIFMFYAIWWFGIINTIRTTPLL